MLDFQKDLDIVFFNQKEFGSRILIDSTPTIAIFDYQTKVDKFSITRYPALTITASLAKHIKVNSTVEVITMDSCKEFRVRSIPSFTVDSEVIEIELSNPLDSVVTDDFIPNTFIPDNH